VEKRQAGSVEMTRWPVLRERSNGRAPRCHGLRLQLVVAIVRIGQATRRKFMPDNLISGNPQHSLPYADYAGDTAQHFILYGIAAF
jgi:hypothetical protein